MDPFSLAGAISTGAGLIGSLFGGKKKASSQPQLIDTRTPEQKAVSAQLTKLLTQGAAPYNGARVAGMTGNEDYTQNYLRNALETAKPGIDRQLSGQFPEEYFNQAIADPTRKQFNNQVAPIIKENSTLTGNRFADRSAIELGTARGQVEDSILQQRGQFGLETYRDPLNATSQLTQTLQGAENIFAVPRTIEQAKLDAQFQEFLRTNPDSGGLIDAMLNFTNQGQNAAYVPNQEQSVYPSLLQAGTSLLGSSSLTNAIQGGSTASNAIGGVTSTLDRLKNRNLYNQSLFSPSLLSGNMSQYYSGGAY